MQVANGIGNTLQNHYFTNPKREYVNVAGLNLSQHLPSRNAVQQSAKESIAQGITGKKKAINKKEFALLVEKSLAHTSLETQKTAQGNAVQLAWQKQRRVYDLQVEGTHEYFANGILVHNCSDAAEYFLTNAFKQWFVKLLYK